MTDNPSPIPITPLGAVMPRSKGAKIVYSVADLAHLLLHEWPTEKRGDAWYAAQSACLRALEAQSNGYAARAAFVMAARDAGISIVQGDVLPSWQSKHTKKTAPE